MKIRIADYIADFFAAKGISDAFSVVGGGAMHLNDAFGHHPAIHTLYNHHEQASAMAAEGYARLNNKPALLIVTTGPGGTNALTGVVGAFTDSIPMIVLSGQVRLDTTVTYAEQFTGGRKLRVVGDQEFPIIESVRAMTKYAVMITDPKTLRFHLEKAYNEAISGRPGPVWIDIPVDIQGMVFDTDEFSEKEVSLYEKPVLSDKVIENVYTKLSKAKRPSLFVGNGIRLSGGFSEFREVMELLRIPVVTYWDSIDLIESNHPLYVGRAGNMGDRAGNFAIENSDLILVIGNRLPIRVTGYSYASWAKNAHVIMVDIDEAELYKPAIHVETKIHADAKDFLTALGTLLKKKPLPEKTEWLKKSISLRDKYPVVHNGLKEEPGKINPYRAFDIISRALSEGTVTVTGNGTPCVAGHQTWYIKKGSRFFNNNGIASMGYGLPASIGACIANQKKPVISLEGDGSVMMNLQELQTVVTNKLPIHLFLLNNEGYHSIRQTQTNIFKEHTKIGIGPESGDLSFPDFEKIFTAFGWPFKRVSSIKELENILPEVLNSPSYYAVELMITKEQFFEPKSATRRLSDGKLVSPPLYDLAPFLPREELKEIMDIPLEEDSE